MRYHFKFLVGDLGFLQKRKRVRRSFPRKIGAEKYPVRAMAVYDPSVLLNVHKAADNGGIKLCLAVNEPCLDLLPLPERAHMRKRHHGCVNTL